MATIGAKFDKKLDIVQIAKLVRADIRKAIKDLSLPKGKYSVTCPRYTSIVVTIKDLQLEYGERLFKAEGEDIESPTRFTPEGHRILNKVKSILEDYRYNDSDIMTDYFNSNFYVDVTYDWRWRKEMTA